MAKRTRTRRLPMKAEELVERALKFEVDDDSSRELEMEARLQRYAKYRQFTADDVEYPWEGASDIALSDLATSSLRVQDTLYNAVTTTHPVLESKAVNKKDREKQQTVDEILDYQAFVENGETWLDSTIEHFTNDGHFTAFIPWVTSIKKTGEVQLLEPIPEEMEPGQYFVQAIQESWDNLVALEFAADTVEESWDFTLQLADQEEPVFVAFYTNKQQWVEMVITQRVTTFDGPKIIVKDREDVLHPAEAENLQPPGPDNPGGAQHVILRDRPTLNTIMQSFRAGFYDIPSEAKMKEILESSQNNIEPSETQQQKADLEGSELEATLHPVQGHNRVTRLQVFDSIDIDGDGVAEEVVYWVIKEHKLLLRMRRLSEAYPAQIPIRPFAEASFIPVAGRRTGIGILELGEGLHNAQKEILDQIIDQGSLLLSPWFFYRPSSNIRPEDIRLSIGEGYPLNNPSQDVFFPQLPNSGMAAGMNTLQLLQKQSERLNMMGDLQFGRVPEGKASALRTVQGMNMVLAQGEERPMRILRRFFFGLGQIWRLMHERNRFFLRPEKQIRISAPEIEGDKSDPYLTVGPSDVDGVFEFEFKANVFNSSKLALQEALGSLMSLFVSPIAMTAGISDENTVYKLMRDLAKAWGQEPDKYINQPARSLPPISAEEAVLEIIDGKVPTAQPAEGPELHLMKLSQFEASTKFGLLEPEQLEAYAEWRAIVEQMLMQMARQQALAQASLQAQGQQAGQPGRPGGDGAPPAPDEGTPLQDNELLDETLTAAGGGGDE